MSPVPVSPSTTTTATTDGVRGCTAGRSRSGSLPTLVCLAAVGVLLLGSSGRAGAATMSFGSPLSVPATMDTAANLGYLGYSVGYISEEQSKVLHISHDGADTALWNVALANGLPTAPASGQITGVSLEGCAKPAPGGPSPLTQIHFQDLAPQAGGGVQVNVTTQPFDAPVCGVGGASGATVTSYQPTNFCVNQGDYVDFNDEGGFAPGSPLAYPSGVPFQVLGSVEGSAADSFVANNGVGNGAVFSPGVVSDRNGFAGNHGEEVMLQATLATGPDATPLCPGGSRGENQPPSKPQAASSRGSSRNRSLHRRHTGGPGRSRCARRGGGHRSRCVHSVLRRGTRRA